MFFRYPYTPILGTIGLVAATLNASTVGLLGTKFEAPSRQSASKLEIEVTWTTAGTFVTPETISDTLGALKPDEELTTRGAREAAVYAMSSPSVVLVVTDSGLGSGSLISETGDIVTNWHVIEGAQKVGVIFKPIREGERVTAKDVWRAQVVKVDEIADLALLRAASVPEGRKPIEIGSLDGVVVGGDVHAIGHPTGEAWTYTRGFVSQIRRDYAWRTESLVDHRADVIQTQTPINPGNSGGPLLNDDGDLIGVNSFQAQGEGLNFAVAVDEVEAFLARSESRYAQRPPETASTGGSDCELRPLATDQTTLGGIQGELSWIDADCDGEADFQAFVPADETEPVVVLVDRNADRRIDTLYFDNDRDGQLDTSLFDTDGDGEPDLTGYHRDGDLEPYRVERIGP